MTALSREIEEAMAEGVRFRTLTLPVEILWDGDSLLGMQAVETRVNGASLGGRRDVHPVAGTEHVHRADVIVSAIGQEHPLQRVLGIASESEAARGLVAPGIYACGDFLTGPGTVASAIASGRRAAAAVRAYLGRTGAWALPEDGVAGEHAPSPSAVRDPADRFSTESAIAIAGTCLRCDDLLTLRSDRCLLCGECVVRCTHEALRWSRDPETGAYGLLVNDEACTRCGDCVGACPAGAIHWSLWTRENRNTDPRIVLAV
jgi:ferredoxin